MLTESNTDSRRERYVSAALDSELAAVRNAGPGNRNATLFQAAASLASITEGLDEDSTRAALEAEATAVGLSAREARAEQGSGESKMLYRSRSMLRTSPRGGRVGMRRGLPRPPERPAPRPHGGPKGVPFGTSPRKESNRLPPTGGVPVP